MGHFSVVKFLLVTKADGAHVQIIIGEFSTFLLSFG